jgi:TolA-binding protein
MLKRGWLLLCLSVFSTAIYAEPTEPCSGLEGADLTQCRTNQQTLRRQERLEQQLQQQQERQNALDKQQRDVQQQLETMRLENESLRKDLAREASKASARAVATNSTDSSKSVAVSKSADLKRWKADNAWFGSDYPRTQFAMRYLKQLEQERPELAGRELLDALSTKVNETFGAKN